MSSDARVHAVVVTYNRKALLLECLEALARQTHPLERVLVVDNATTDGTPEALAASGIAERLPVQVLRLSRNGGGAEGFHYGVRHAREADADWLWLMDDDCEAPPDCLASLLAHPRAQDPGTALLAPLVHTPGGEVLPLNRGWVRPRWFLGPLVGTGPEHLERDEVAIEHAALVGPLVRTAAARAVDPPRRDFFIWWDDLEWSLRLGEVGGRWLLPGSAFVHKDAAARPLPDTSLAARWRDFRTGLPFSDGWKRAYGLRNMVFTGRRHGFMSGGQAVAYGVVHVVRALLGTDHRLRAAWLAGRYTRDGWRGAFANVPPARWRELADAPDPRAALARERLRYDDESDLGGVATLGRIPGASRTS